LKKKPVFWERDIAITKHQVGPKRYTTFVHIWFWLGCLGLEYSSKGLAYWCRKSSLRCAVLFTSADQERMINSLRFALPSLLTCYYLLNFASLSYPTVYVIMIRPRYTL